MRFFLFSIFLSAMLRLFFAACAVHLAPSTDPGVLELDDECNATQSCSFTALQLRSGAQAQDEVYQDFEASANRSQSKVSFIFTYGAVATSKEPLEDLSQPTRAFAGVRCYTETVYMSFARQTDAGSDLNLLMHPKAELLVWSEICADGFFSPLCAAS